MMLVLRREMFEVIMSSKKENKSYLCTSCHMLFENRKYLALFN